MDLLRCARAFSVASVVIGVLVVAACDSNSSSDAPATPPPKSGACGSCAEHADCQGGLCHNQQCTAACKDEATCKTNGFPGACVDSLCVCAAPVRGNTLNCLPCKANADCASGLCQGTTCYGGDVNGKCESDANCSGGNAPGYTGECVKKAGVALGDCICHKTPDGGNCALAMTPDIVGVNAGGTASGGVGAWVDIAVLNVDPVLAGNAVTFNGVAAPIVDSQPATATSVGRFFVRVPAGAQTGPLKITTCAGASPQASPFTVSGTHAPVITSFTPMSGNSSTSVTMIGTNFTGAINCQFFGAMATYVQPATVTGDTMLTCNMTDSTVGEMVRVGVGGAAGVGIGVADTKFTVTQ